MSIEQNSYNAIITRISTRPHPNADRLLLGTCQNFQVVVGLDTKDSDLGVFFPSDGQLSLKYAYFNDLVGYVDGNGKKQGGYFGKNRRVRSQSFRGEKSEGYWAPLDSLKFTNIDIDSLDEGDTFHNLEGIDICNKYYTPATLRHMEHESKHGKKGPIIDFPEHVNTLQLKYQLNRIPIPSNIYCTEKMHGTSGRTGRLHVSTPYKKKWYEILGDLIKGNGFSLVDYKDELRPVTGSRRRVLTDSNIKGFYGVEEFRKIVLPQGLGDKLYENEIIYYEIVGYTDTGKSIMPSVSTKAIKDKDFHKRYGDTISFTYGCREGTCKLYVYRVAYKLGDRVIDLPWEQVMYRCNQLGLSTVMELESTRTRYVTKEPDLIMHLVNRAMEDDSSYFDARHIKEGVVLRIESETGVQFLKYKSHRFYVLEGVIKEDDDYVDIEEAG